MIKKRNSAYWKERMLQVEDSQYKQSAKYYKDVQEQFRIAENDIKLDIDYWYQRLADNNDISFASAKRLLQKDELKEFHWSVQKYIKKGKENALDKRWIKELENASVKYHISYLDAMKLQIQQHAELLSTQFENGITDFLNHSYADNFYHTAYEIAKGKGVGSNLARLDTRKIDVIIKKPWAQDKKNFSERIWQNKEKLVQNLHTELTQNIIRGTSPRKAIQTLSDVMKVSQSNAGRLIMTESAAISSRAQQDCFAELGVKKYEVVATLDAKTSEICQEMDGKVFEQTEYQVGLTAPPFHPWCRTTTVPYFDENFDSVGERAARNEETGKTEYVPANMTYKEWKRIIDEDGEFESKRDYERKHGKQEKIEKDLSDDIIKLSEEELGALQQYKSFEAYVINDALRNIDRIEKLNEQQQQFIQILDRALSKIGTYRGNLLRTVDFSDWTDIEERIEKFLEEYIPGEIVTIHQYWSTAKEEGYNDNASIKIYIQNAKKGRDISAIGLDEKEVLYERESRFKVISKVFDDGVWYILLQEV